jgi:hypothetical protein
MNRFKKFKTEKRRANFKAPTNHWKAAAGKQLLAQL